MAKSISADKRENEKKRKDSPDELKNKKRKKKKNYPTKPIALKI